MPQREVSMTTLTRFAGPLAIIAGALWVIAIVIQSVSPLSYAWFALIAAMVLIGGAALGLQQLAGPRGGRLVRWGAGVTAVGSIGVLASIILAFATSPGNMATPPPPAVIALSFLSFLVWLVGSIVLALGLMRADAISPVAGWLIVIGSIFGSIVLAAAGQNPPSFLFLPLALSGVGWVLVGIEARAPRANVPVAGHAV